jgi:hypothetical protein
MATTRRIWASFSPSALGVLGAFALIVLSGPSVACHPSLEETRDYIVLKLSGGSVSARVQCDQVQECRGFVDTTWQNRTSRSPSSCSIEVVQNMNVTKTQSAMCVWTGDVIGGKLWNHVTYQREYHFWLDFGSISRDGITVEQATPENSQCFVAKSDLPYSVHLNFTNRMKVSFRLKATGSVNGDMTSSEERGEDTWINSSFPVGGEDAAEKLALAFQHAATLCGAKKETF